MHAMRLGPGKHLKGLKLADGCVTPEEFDYFHELIISQEFSRVGQRGYGDGMQVRLYRTKTRSGATQVLISGLSLSLPRLSSQEWSLVYRPSSTLAPTN